MSEQINHSSRAHALLSASSSARWLACPASAIAAKAYPPQDTDYTREGTLAHEEAERIARLWVLNKGEREDTPKESVTQEMTECAHGYADYIQEHTGTNSVILLEQRVDFSPWVPEGFGTADCIIIHGNVMHVIDYKYGRGVAVSAEDNPQIKLYGLGALNDYGFAYDIKGIQLHIYQPRTNNVSQSTVLVPELMEWAEKVVKPTAAKAAQGKGGYNPGEHCRFCPHAGRCRSLAKVCTEYVTVHGKKMPVDVMTPWEVAEALKMEPIISLWAKRVKDQALTSMLNGEQIPGYKVVEGKLGNRKWTDEAKVWTTLSGAGFSPEEFTETKILSPAALDKAIGKKKVTELLPDLIDRSPGSPTVVPESDKRPAYDRLAEAQKDFE